MNVIRLCKASVACAQIAARLLGMYSGLTSSCGMSEAEVRCEGPVAVL